MLYRLQDEDGRGPFRPGFSNVWQDATGTDFPAIYEELGIAPQHLRKLIPAGMSAGCACRSREMLRQWFSRSEERRLKRHGFTIVAFEPDLIIAETATQVLFAMRTPLTTLARAA